MHKLYKHNIITALIYALTVSLNISEHPFYFKPTNMTARHGKTFL